MSVATQAALTAQAAGAKVDLPDPAAMRKEFDDLLMQDDQDVDPVELIKMRALGVSRGR